MKLNSYNEDRENSEGRLCKWCGVVLVKGRDFTAVPGCVDCTLRETRVKNQAKTERMPSSEPKI